MKLFKVYGNELCSIDVKKETKCFYFVERYLDFFGYSRRIEKEKAMLTPQEAIQEALNHRRTMFGAYMDKAKSAERDIEKLKELAREHGMLREA